MIVFHGFCDGYITKINALDIMHEMSYLVLDFDINRLSFNFDLDQTIGGDYYSLITVILSQIQSKALHTSYP